VTGAPSPEQVRARIEAIRAARGGYVLPHHGAMAAALPELHAAYEAMYRALTLDPRHMSAHAREVVWLAILSACEEPVGTHHLHRFMETGGTEAEAATVFRLAAWARGAATYGTLAAHWAVRLPGLSLEAEYAAGARALLDDTPSTRRRRGSHWSARRRRATSAGASRARSRPPMPPARRNPASRRR
jgi:hypothetical protein